MSAVEYVAWSPVPLYVGGSVLLLAAAVGALWMVAAVFTGEITFDDAVLILVAVACFTGSLALFGFAV